MTFEKLQKQQPAIWQENAHLFKQEHDLDNGYVGGWAGIGRPGQREIVRRSEKDEILADDTRGRRVILINVLIVLLVLFAVTLLGPAAIVWGVIAGVIALSYWLVGWPWRKHEDVPNKDVSLVWSVATVACVLWLAIVDAIAWDWIAGWYPIPFVAPWWIVVPVWAVIGALLNGFGDLREAHRRSLFNRNWPPTFEQMPPDVGPYYHGEYALIEEPEELDNSQVEAFREILRDVLPNKKQQPLLETIIVRGANKNGNPLHKHPDPGGQALPASVAEVIMRETDENKRIFLYTQHGNEKSIKVPMDVIRTFVRCAPSSGSRFRDWEVRGVSQGKQETIRRVLELSGIITLRDGEVVWNLEVGEAIREFDRMFQPCVVEQGDAG